MIFVHRLRKDYSMDYFNSKRIRKKNENRWGVFWIMVLPSPDISLHFNENSNFRGILYIYRNFQIFVHRLRKDYLMKKFNSKRFRNKNENPRGVFWIMVSRSLDVSLHFNENLIISGILYIFFKNSSKSTRIGCSSMSEHVLISISKVTWVWYRILVFSGCFEAF